MHAAELGVRGSWRHWELSVLEPQASGGCRSRVGPRPRSLPYSVTAALEDPSLGPPGWRPTAWAAPEDSQDGQGRGAHCPDSWWRAPRCSHGSPPAPLTTPHHPAHLLVGPSARPHCRR